MAEQTEAVSPNGLDEFTEWINNFCDTNHIPGCLYKPEYDEILDYEESEILMMNSDECFAKALILMNYATYLSKRMNIIKSQMKWCKETLDFLVAKYWNNYGGGVSWEVKRNMIIKDNSYMINLQRFMIQLESSLNIMESSYHDIKKRVSILENLGKKKGFA